MKLESEIKAKTEQNPEGKDVRWKVFRPVLDAKKCDPTCVSIALCPRAAIEVVNAKP